MPPRDFKYKLAQLIAKTSARVIKCEFQSYGQIVSGCAADSKMANISTRGFVETGDNVMIGGFIVGNNPASTKVVVRAIGPSLQDRGVPNALQDPTIELHDGNGVTFASNDNWQDDPGAAEIQSKQLAPNDARESATLQTLVPGAYSAIVRGKGDKVGVALVEIYNVR